MGTKTKHSFQELTGSRLDMHLMVMHGWSRDMVRKRGTQSDAEHYADIWHRNAHHAAPAVKEKA